MSKRSLVICLALILDISFACAAGQSQIPTYKRLKLVDAFLAEGANCGDINGDGVIDVVAGPYWFAGPDFTERVAFYDGKSFDIEGYSDNFLTFVHDINLDGHADILVFGFPGKAARWYRNPAGKSGSWPVHIAFPTVDNESPTFADITGDGRPELIFHTKGRLGFAEINSDDPTQPWKFLPISEPRGYQRFTHGLGYGDLNGDGRIDLLTKEGWWEQPAQIDQRPWPFHSVEFAEFGGAQMLVSDVDGDGDQDVITSKHAHGYGLSWFENYREASTIKFREHLIMGEHPEDKSHGVAFSQLHALALADFDDDGIDDIVTGKRFWAHQGKDVGGHDPAVLYAFLTVRENQQVHFEPHRIDTNSGVGTQVVAKDINRDGQPDIIVGNKKGVFVQLSNTKSEREGIDSTTDHSTASEPKADGLKFYEYPFAGQTAEQAVRGMTLPDGFSATVFAAEPDVKQPIAMALDERGRIWIAEAYEYPQRAPEGEGRDRILVFEDVDGDGHFDNRKVFADGLNLVSGLEIGFGGVWVGAAPYLMFIPDRNGDDIPDAEPQVLLDGWGYQDTHETLNAFTWGPDGWLYGCQGVFTHSKVGKPGTPADQRTPINAGVWRYHPTRHTFEVFSHGTSNPWGVDFNDHGQAICTACVIPHLFHMVQGGRYHRQAGRHFNPHTYDDLKTIADHAHYAGNIADHAWWGRDEAVEDHSTDAAGGGHAHAGAMIYLGGSWPEEYRGRVFMNNIHGARINQDHLTPHGSGYIGSHRPDFLFTHDRASQIINLRYGPAGQVYMIDWYDMQACHHRSVTAHDRSNGRIYKVSYGSPQPMRVDLRENSDLELAKMVLNKNDWYVRHSRRILQHRNTTGELSSEARDFLVEIATSHADETRRLRAMWVLHVTGGCSPSLRDKMIADKSDFVRAWSVQLSLESGSVDPDWLSRLTQLAQQDSSAVVRLYLASALQRIDEADRWGILQALTSHASDADDHNLPLMYWYAAEPLVEVDLARALDFGLSCGQSAPLLRDFMLRRIGQLGTPDSLATLVVALGDSETDSAKLSILSAIRRALKGRRQVEPPESWAQVYRKLVASQNEELVTQATAIGVSFGDDEALTAFRALVVSADATLEKRREALQALLLVKAPKLVDTLQLLIAEPAMRDLALNGLAAYEDVGTPAVILSAYNSFSPSEKQRALATLASRSAHASELLKAVAEDRVPVTDFSADLVRQLHNLKDSSISDQLNDLWGTVRNTPEDKLQQIKELRKLVRSKAAKLADPELGRAVFAKTCQQCHKLYGVGETIGPDLTGSNRSNVDYLLSNIVDPSALISKEYQNSVIVTDGGRVLTGIVTTEDENSVTVRTTTETHVVPKEEIEERVLSATSMMPENQLKQLSKQETVSLFAYLRGKSQVPQLATKENAKALFNGRDLTGWQGDMGLWSVEDGEIVGRTAGLKQNSFLISDLAAEDFRLSIEVLLKDDKGNSGIQFRSQRRQGVEEVYGYQADIGPDWWGKLYEEHGRGLLSSGPDKVQVNSGQWNHYEIRAEGNRIQTSLNGQLCCDIDDPDGLTRGVFALQIHSGGETEVRFRNLRLEIFEQE